MVYYYIFYYNGNEIPIYERTTQCENRAKERVNELDKIYSNTFYAIDKLPENFYY